MLVHFTVKRYVSPFHKQSQETFQNQLLLLNTFSTTNYQPICQHLRCFSSKIQWLFSNLLFQLNQFSPYQTRQILRSNFIVPLHYKDHFAPEFLSILDPKFEYSHLDSLVFDLLMLNFLLYFLFQHFTPILQFLSRFIL